MLAGLALVTGCRAAPATPDAGAPPPSYTLRPVLPDLDAQQVAKVVEGMVQGTTHERATITFVADEQHLWHVSYVAGGRPKELWITRDGRFATAAVTDVPALRDRLDRDGRFADCLDKAGVRLFIDASPASRELLAAAGVAAERVAVRCDLPDSDCGKLGITSLPSVRAGGEVHAGAVTRAWLESRTACK